MLNGLNGPNSSKISLISSPPRIWEPVRLWNYKSTALSSIRPSFRILLPRPRWNRSRATCEIWIYCPLRFRAFAPFSDRSKDFSTNREISNLILGPILMNFHAYSCITRDIQWYQAQYQYVEAENSLEKLLEVILSLIQQSTCRLKVDWRHAAPRRGIVALPPFWICLSLHSPVPSLHCPL